jgi:transposase
LDLLKGSSMLDQEKVMELKVLNKQGQSVKAIARISGAARNTVRKYVRDGAKAQRKPRASRLDAYRDWLIARLLQSPGIPASVLRRELEERGCVMGGARLREVVSKLRPKAIAEPVVRYETAPGVQAQVDFATMSFGAFSFKPTKRGTPTPQKTLTQLQADKARQSAGHPPLRKL